MSNPRTAPAAQSQLLEEAASWFARMRGPDAEASRERFEAWLALGTPQRQAYNRAAEIFALGKLLDRKDEAVVPARPKAMRAAVAMTGAIAVLLCLAAALVLADGTGGQNPFARANPAASSKEQRLVAGTGEARNVRLADGSLVELASGSVLDVRFDRALRSLSLEGGSARFTVAHEQRPFVVSAGGGSVTARGTIFEVAVLAGKRVTVHLLDGIVELKAPDAPVRRLRRGERASFAAVRVPARGPAGGVVVPETAILDGGTSSEPHEYDAIRLAELVALANRDSSRPIRLAEPMIGERHVSGHFRTDDTRLLAERLAILLDLEADEHGTGEVVLRRRPGKLFSSRTP